jgi:hypothetical protein
MTVVASLCHCTSDSGRIDQPDNDQSVIQLLGIGNEWNYRVSIVDQVTSDTSETYMSRTLILRDTLIDSEQWYTAITQTPSDTTAQHLTNRESGLWSYEPVLDQTQSPVLIAKYPGNPGEVWLMGDVEATIVSADTTISVLGMEYDCYHYREEFTLGEEAIVINEYYSPNIGLILEVGNYSVSSADRVVRELSSYILRPVE